jgi:hypothetical protein
MTMKLASLVAVCLSGCAIMTKSPYEYTVSESFGERVALNTEEKSVLDSNFSKAEWMLAYDELGWVSTDTLRHRLGHKLDTSRLGSWVAVDSVVYYGKIKEGQFQIAYTFDFRNKQDFFKENAVPILQPDATQLALAQDKALNLFLDDTTRNHTDINPCLRKQGRYIDVYLIPAHTPKFYVLGGGRRYRFDSETLQLIEKKKLHENAHFAAGSKDDHAILWSSRSNAVLNEVDIFQAYRLKKKFNFLTIMTPKYIFTHEGLAKEFKFDVFGTQHLEAMAAKRKK